MEGQRWTAGHRAGLAYHRRMLDDHARMDAYERAMRALVRPGDVVLDVGAGTGILSLLAARCGASRVHAVESMPVARLARALAAHNGFDDRIVVHQADLVTLEPAEKVDLVVGDFMGCWVVDDGMLPAVAAAGRWLKPGGRCCPSKLTMRLAPAGNLVLDEVDTFRSSIYGVDLAPAAAQALHRCYRADLSAAMVLAAPMTWAELTPPDVGRSLDGTARFVIEKAGALRVVAGWFEAELAPGVRLANAPGSSTHWGQHLFPVPATDVQAGDVIEMSIRILGDRSELAWIWSGTITRGDRELASFHLDDREADDVPSVPPRDLPAGNPSYLAQELNRFGAEAYLRSDWPEARRLWEDAIAVLGPRDEMLPPLYENLGMALAQGGRRAAAIRALLRALDGDPTAREQARRFLDELGWTPPPPPP